jgi:hypothetical protein
MKFAAGRDPDMKLWPAMQETAMDVFASPAHEK